jgi:hypothetical protein
MIRVLQKTFSDFIGEPVTAAAISILHLVALYCEDLVDAFEYLSVAYLEFYSFWNFIPIPSTVAAFVVNGQGLCQDYRNVTQCKEEELQMPARYALSVSYTDTALTTSSAYVYTGYGGEEIPTWEDLQLGYNVRHREGYWEAVRTMLSAPILKSVIHKNTSIVLVFGDATEEPSFRSVLEGVIDDVIRG